MRTEQSVQFRQKAAKKSLDIVPECKYNKRGMVWYAPCGTANFAAVCFICKTGIWPGTAFIAAWRFVMIYRPFGRLFETISHGDERTPPGRKF